MFLHAESEDSDQTGRMVFAGRKGHEAAHFVLFTFEHYSNNPKLYGPRQANLVLIAYASSEGSGEPAHPRSLARTFATRSYRQCVKRNLQT